MHSLPLDIVIFGEALATFIAEDKLPLELAERYSKLPGGVGIDVAFGLSQLDHHVGWLSRLGSDPLGYYLLHTIQQAEIDTTRMLLDDHHATGFQLQSRADDAHSTVASYRTGSAISYMEPDADDDAYVRRARHLHVTGIPPALSDRCRQYTNHILEQARSAGISTSFEPDFSRDLWGSQNEMHEIISDLVTRVDIVFTSAHEGASLTGSSSPEGSARYYLDRGVKFVVMYAGRDGAYLFTGGQRYRVPVLSEQVKNTVRMREGFVTGILSALLEKLSPDNWLERGNALAALAAASSNDPQDFANRDRLAHFLRRYQGKVQRIAVE